MKFCLILTSFLQIFPYTSTFFRTTAIICNLANDTSQERKYKITDTKWNSYPWQVVRCRCACNVMGIQKTFHKPTMTNNSASTIRSEYGNLSRQPCYRCLCPKIIWISAIQIRTTNHFIILMHRYIHICIYIE